MGARQSSCWGCSAIPVSWAEREQGHSSQPALLLLICAGAAASVSRWWWEQAGARSAPTLPQHIQQPADPSSHTCRNSPCSSPSRAPAATAFIMLGNDLWRISFPNTGAGHSSQCVQPRASCSAGLCQLAQPKQDRGSAPLQPVTHPLLYYPISQSH